MRLSCPTSTLPVKAVTSPSPDVQPGAPAAGQRSGRPAGGRTTTSPSPSSANHSRSSGADMSHGRAGRGSSGRLRGPALRARPRRGPAQQPGGPRGRSRVAAAPAQPGSSAAASDRRGGRVRRQQRRGGSAIPGVQYPHCDARSAIRPAAPGAAAPRPGRQALDRGNRPPGRIPGPLPAGQHRPAVDEHRARAARTLAAAFLDSGQAQLRSQERKQALSPADLARLGVDGSAAHVSFALAFAARLSSSAGSGSRTGGPRRYPRAHAKLAQPLDFLVLVHGLSAAGNQDAPSGPGSRVIFVGLEGHHVLVLRRGQLRPAGRTEDRGLAVHGEVDRQHHDLAVGEETDSPDRNRRQQLQAPVERTGSPDPRDRSCFSISHSVRVILLFEAFGGGAPGVAIRKILGITALPSATVPSRSRHFGCAKGQWSRTHGPIATSRPAIRRRSSR